MECRYPMMTHHYDTHVVHHDSWESVEEEPETGKSKWKIGKLFKKNKGGKDGKKKKFGFFG